jgi:hypothetical protein
VIRAAADIELPADDLAEIQEAADTVSIQRARYSEEVERATRALDLVPQTPTSRRSAYVAPSWSSRSYRSHAQVISISFQEAARRQFP